MSRISTATLAILSFPLRQVFGSLSLRDTSRREVRYVALATEVVSYVRRRGLLPGGPR